MKEPKLKEAREFIRKSRDDWRRGWTNQIGSDKGKVTSPLARHAIACLTVALENLHIEKPKKKNERRKLRRK